MMTYTMMMTTVTKMITMMTIIMMMIITAGPGHINVRGHHDCKVGGLGRHWVGVDLAHVVACVLNGYLEK